MDKIAELKEFIQRCYVPGDNGDMYWETGNMDDTFEMGCHSGYSNALLYIGRTFLDMELPDKDEQKGY